MHRTNSANPLLLRTLGRAAVRARAGRLFHVKGWFGGKKDDGKPNEPAELTDITPSVTVSKLWSANAGKGEGRMGARQGPVVADGRVYAAAVEGGVRAFDLQTGKAVWHYDPKRAAPVRRSRRGRGPGRGRLASMAR